ncbi:Rpn family recombination-promoting nuclease/putative transposase [Thiocapsa sp.]|uniref:Rpn family recombination-promoting nuclease/putative transposase n=1 Tax=Thiocapsa sp. TaxID=2024551 RepID=UPI001BCAD3D1|nr:Rpn family recombination-promoting nuclease/putative transposase [Thiocapsa sp.]
MTTTPTPHDCFFRENFARPAIARDVLRHVLPQALCEAIDLERLTISTDTFVTEALRNGERVRELLELITKVSRDPPRSTSWNPSCATMSKAPGDSTRHRSVTSSNKPSRESP